MSENRNEYWYGSGVVQHTKFASTFIPIITMEGNRKYIHLTTLSTYWRKI